jgi:hypothetical protein
MQKSIGLLYTNNEFIEKEIRKTFPFKKLSKQKTTKDMILKTSTMKTIN